MILLDFDAVRLGDHPLQFGDKHLLATRHFGHVGMKATELDYVAIAVLYPIVLKQKIGHGVFFSWPLLPLGGHEWRDGEVGPSPLWFNHAADPSLCSVPQQFLRST